MADLRSVLVTLALAAFVIAPAAADVRDVRLGVKGAT